MSAFCFHEFLLAIGNFLTDTQISQLTQVSVFSNNYSVFNMFKYIKENNNDNKDSKAADYLQQWKLSGDKYKMASRYLYNEGSAKKSSVLWKVKHGRSFSRYLTSYGIVIFIHTLFKYYLYFLCVNQPLLLFYYVTLHITATNIYSAIKKWCPQISYCLNFVQKCTCPQVLFIIYYNMFV